MSDLSSIERLKFETLFGMESGYVLDFSNNTFSMFTIENVGIDIFDSKYEYGSSSKANRLRKFWIEESNEVVGKLLSALLDYWLVRKQLSGNELSSKEETLYDDCQKIVKRLNRNSFRQTQENTSSPSQKGRIFISYRRIDSAGYAGRIYDRLVANFGVDAIFMDVDTIEGGTDFVKVLEDAVQSCDVLITLIGRQWLGIKDNDGNRRLDSPEDFVRIEIATALKRNIRVIPVLVDGVDMPQPTELPENLKALARRNALQVHHHSFNPDVYRLIEHTKSALDEAEELRGMKAETLQAILETAAKEKAERAAVEKRKTDEETKHEKAIQQKAKRDAADKAKKERIKHFADQMILIKRALSIFITSVKSAIASVKPLYWGIGILSVIFVGLWTIKPIFPFSLPEMPSATPSATITLIPPTKTRTPTPTRTHLPTLTPSFTPTVTLTPTPIPTTSILLHEDFEDNKANGWVPSYIKWSIEQEPDGNHYLSASGTENMYAWISYGDKNTKWTDYAFESRIKFVEGPHNLSVWVRADDILAYYSLLIYSGIHRFGQHSTNYTDWTGIDKWLSSELPRSFEQGEWYTIRVEIKGDMISAYVDNIYLGDAKFSLPPVNKQGGIGFGFDGGEVVNFDDIRVWSLK